MFDEIEEELLDWPYGTWLCCLVLEKLDVGRDVAVAMVDICWVLEGRDTVDFVVDGVTFKHDKPADEPTDRFCDRTGLAEDTGLAPVTVEVDLDPAREIVWTVKRHWLKMLE